MSPRAGTSQVAAGSRGRAHGEPRQRRRYASHRQLIVFHVVIVLKCQRGEGSNEASPVRNARDSSQRPGGVLITGSAETVQPQRASLPDLLRGGRLPRRRSAAALPAPDPHRAASGRAPHPPAASSRRPRGRGAGGLLGLPPRCPWRQAGEPKAQAAVKGEGEGLRGFLEDGLVWAGRAAFGCTGCRRALAASILALYNELPSN